MGHVQQLCNRIVDNHVLTVENLYRRILAFKKLHGADIIKLNDNSIGIENEMIKDLISVAGMINDNINHEKWQDLHLIKENLLDFQYVSENPTPKEDLMLSLQ